MSDVDKTLNERGQRYGQFEDHAFITQELKDTMRATPNWARLKKDQREALEMVAHKIGRILNGDPDYIDSWHDIIGYTKLVENRLIEEEAFRARAQGAMDWSAENRGAADDKAVADTATGERTEAKQGEDERNERVASIDDCTCPGCTARRKMESLLGQKLAGRAAAILELPSGIMRFSVRRDSNA